MTGLPITRAQRLLMCLSVVVLTSVSAAVHFADWYGSWGETSRALEDSTSLTYPVVAATAAWFTSNPLRRRYQWMIDSACRSRYSVYLRATGTYALLASSGFVLTAVAMCIGTATQSNFGQPAVVDMFTIVAGFFAMASWGALVATLLPALISPIVSLVAVYAIEVWADTGNPSLLPLAGLTVADPRERTYRTTATWMLEMRGVWLLALAFLFVAVATRAGSRWLVPFVVACLAATPLLLGGETGMAINKAATRPVCHHPSSNVTVCLTAARDHTFPTVWSALRPEIALLSGLAPRQWHLAEEGIDDEVAATYQAGTVTVPFGIANGTNGNAHVVNRKQLQADFSERLLQANCRPVGAGSDGRKPPATQEDVVQGWLLTELGVPIDGVSGYEFPQLGSDSLDYAAVRTFRNGWNSMTRNDRQTWFEQHGRQLVECELQSANLASP